MTITDNFEIPSIEDLTVEEVNISTPALKAGAVYFGKYCDEHCKEFMLCKRENTDPRDCLGEGKLVTSCAMEFFRKVKKSCFDSFQAHAKCLDYSSQDLQHAPCRKTQAAFDMCMLEKLEMERPEVGFFSRPRIHQTNRSKPVTKAFREYPTRDELPDDFPRDRAFGDSRYFY